MVRAPDAGDRGIDLDRLDTLHAGAQRGGDVVARAGADDRGRLRRRADLVRQLVVARVARLLRVRGLRGRREIVDLLVVEPGGADDRETAPPRTALDELIGRVDPVPIDRHRPRERADRDEARDGAEHERFAVDREEREKPDEARREPDRRRRPERARDEHRADAGETADEIPTIRREAVRAIHQASGELPERHERDRGQHEERREEEADCDELERAPRDREAHVEALLERHRMEALPERGIEPVAEREEQDELPREQRDHEAERKLVTPRERVAEPEPEKAGEQPEVLVEREELEDGRLPADHRELEEEPEPGRRGDGEREARARQAVEPFRLRAGRPLDPRLEPVKQSAREEEARNGETDEHREGLGRAGRRRAREKHAATDDDGRESEARHERCPREAKISGKHRKAAG